MILQRIISASGGFNNTAVHNPYRNGHPREIIETLRVQQGFTSARALALAAGVNQPTLARYLNGTSDTMEVSNFQKLAEVLEVTLSELLGEVPISIGGKLRELIRIMDELPDPEREALLAAGRAMANATKHK